MQKAIKHIALSMVMLSAGITADAKHTPGIPPVYAPQGAPERAAWQVSENGAALRELDSRSPDKLMRTLMQEDGIVDFRPERLVGPIGQSQPAHAIRQLPQSKIPGGSNICGFIAHNDLDLDLGVYRLPLAAAQQVDLLRDATGLLSSFRGGASSEEFYVMSYYGTTVQNGVDQCLTAIFDKSDWRLIAEVGDYGQYERTCSDMTYDPVTKRFYGCFLTHNKTQWVLGYMQLDSSDPAGSIATVTELYPLEVSLNGLAADANGVLWGIRNDNGDLVKINKKTGAMTTVASTGFVPGYNGSLTWDNTNGLLYWSVTYQDAASPSGIGSAILTVDPQTGTLAHVYDFAGAAQTCGLYSEFTAARLTPGQFSSVVADFAGELLSGTVVFDAPSTLTDGSVATGTLDYTLSVVKDNGYEAYRGEHSCRYGDKGISVAIGLKTAGYYTFTLTGHNDAGNGYPVSVTRYVGLDLPQSPENVGITSANGTLTVTWDAVDATVHGGYFDPQTVKYIVNLTEVDADGNVRTLPTATVRETMATWSVDASGKLFGYQASVVPVFDTNEGEAALTGYIWFGSLSAPFVQQMTARTDGWTTYAVGKSSPWQKVFSNSGRGWAIPYYWGSRNDAWLFSPAITLEKGRYYTFTFKAWSTIVDNTLDMWMGRSATVDGMSMKLDEVKVPGGTTLAKASTFTFGFECQETGVYHLGIHNSTKSDTYTNAPYMWVNDVTCDVAPDSAPAAPGLDVDYDKTGSVSARVTVISPTHTYGNSALTKLDKLILKCNGAVVEQWDDVDAGVALTYDYEGGKAGMYTFVAEAVENGVTGVPNISTFYLGMSLPAEPEWVNVVEQTGTPGTVDVTWAPVTQAANGQEIAEEAITYNVMNILSNTYVERGLTGESLTFEACSPEEQTSLYVSVNAETSAGVSSTYGRRSESIMHVGKPYQLPLHEDFAGGGVHYSWTMVNQHSAYDHVSVINSLAELGDADANGDGYCLSAFVPYANSQASLYSGMIEIPADANNPVISFAIYSPQYDGENDNTLIVSIIGSKTQGSLAPLRVGDQKVGWQYYYYDMSMFKGETLNLLLTFQTFSYTNHYIDDIHFFDAYTKDLAINSMSVNSKSYPGNALPVGVSIINIGTDALAKNTAKVELRRGDTGMLVAERNIPALGPFQSTTVKFVDNPNNSFDPVVTYKARIVYDGDQNQTNDAAEAVTEINLPSMPAPQSLTGMRDSDGFASLSWEAPDLSPDFPMYEIGFESSVAPSCVDMEGFTTIDVDGNEVYGELGLSGPQGFTTFPHSTLAHSGKWMIVSPCNADGAAKEDWLVSPRLSGHAQTISFYVRTNWSAYEHFTVLTSATGCDRSDFTTTVLDMTTTSNDWQRVEIDIPEGTLYFAIVSKADDTTDLIYLMLDDFTFEGADTNDGLVVEGYNAYRDNVMIEEVDAGLSWNDSKGTSGPHFYRVTARYDGRGESAPSNELFLFTRGENESGVNTVAGNVGKVYTRPGRIFIDGADGCEVSVTAVSGVRIAGFAVASASESVEVIPGVYIVTIDGASVKVRVP